MCLQATRCGQRIILWAKTPYADVPEAVVVEIHNPILEFDGVNIAVPTKTAA